MRNRLLQCYINSRKILAWAAVTLCIAQVILVLASWLLTAAMPDSFMHSLLSAEGIRWFFGKFQDNVASPILVWMIVCSVAYGSLRKGGLLRYNSMEYRQRVALRFVVAELIVFTIIMMLLTMLPHAILLNVMGGIYPSSFSKSIIPYFAFCATVMGCTFGVMSDKLKSVTSVYEALVSGISTGAPFIVIYLLVVQLYYSILFCIR